MISLQNEMSQTPAIELTDRVVFTESQLLRQSWTSSGVEESSQSGRNKLDQDGSKRVRGVYDMSIR